VVIDDFDLVRVGFFPFKANAPLVVNTDAALAPTIALQVLESVSRQSRKRPQVRRGVQHIQFSKRLTFYGPEPPNPFPAEKGLGVGASKGPDHRS